MKQARIADPPENARAARTELDACIAEQRDEMAKGRPVWRALELVTRKYDKLRAAFFASWGTESLWKQAGLDEARADFQREVLRPVGEP